MAKEAATWKRQPIVNLCAEHVDCVNRTAPVVSGPTPFKMIRTTNVRNGYIDTENVRYVTEPVYRRWTRRLVPRRGDIILTREAPLGDVGKIRSDDLIFLGQRLYHFRPDPTKLDADFLLYALMSPDLQGQIRGFGSGSTVQHMRLADIPELEILAAPLHTQKKIGAILSAYDDLIGNNERRIRILEDMAQNLYREWFVKFRFPGHKKVKLVNSPPEGRGGALAKTDGKIPQGWEVKSVADSFRILGGGTPSKKVPEYWENGNISWYTPSDLTAAKSMFIESCSDQITEAGLKNTSARMFPAMSVMLTSRATIGAIAINTKPACTNQGFITCIPNEAIPLHYLYFWLRENTPTFIRMASGATFKEISKGVFKSIDVLLPVGEVRDSFERTVKPMADNILNLQRRSANLRRTRDMLLPRLVSDAVDVSELDINVPEAMVN